MSSTSEVTNEPKLSIQAAANFCGISSQAIHKQLKNKNISCPKYGNKSYLTFLQAKQLLGLSFEKKIVSSQIVKGGTGKTTGIDNISSCMNSMGARVLKIDLDPQGNLTDANGVDAEQYPTLIDIIKNKASVEEAIVNICSGMDIVPSRIENVILDNEIVNQQLRLDKVFSHIFSPIIDNYDYIFIDCPPTMGQSVAAATLWSDIVLAPLNPDKFSAKGLKILKNEIDRLNKSYDNTIKYKVFLNKFSGKTILSDKALVSLVSDPELDGKLLSSMISNSQEIPNFIDSDKTAFSTVKKSFVREDFRSLALELLDINYQKNSVTRQMELANANN